MEERCRVDDSDESKPVGVEGGPNLIFGGLRRETEKTGGRLRNFDTFSLQRFAI